MILPNQMSVSASTTLAMTMTTPTEPTAIPDFIGVEVLQLTYKVCHKAQTQLAGEVREIVAFAHYERCAVLIHSGALFFTECHIVFLLFFRELIPCF